MIFGGIPYYLNLFDRGLSFSQNVDKLCFADRAPLRNEFDELYMSLFSNPHSHISVVETLAKKKSGMNRSDISKLGKLPQNGHLTATLGELEQCDFIERYTDFTKKKNGAHFYLKDPFTLFFLRFMKDNNSKDEYFWTNRIDDGANTAWSGYAFELVCRMHIKHIKAKLGVLGVSTETMSWRSKDSDPGAQVDLLITRRDGVVNLCEMKFKKHPFEISKAYAEELERKRAVFAMESGTKNAIHITLVTTYGLAKKGYFSIAQSEVLMDDFFYNIYRNINKM